MTALKGCGQVQLVRRRCSPVGPRASLRATPPPRLLHHLPGRALWLSLYPL